METYQEHYDAMAKAIALHAPYVDMELIDEAVAYAQEKHKDQKRKDGSPYIIHPLAVAEIVAETGLDTDAVVAALLHDCIEDTDASFDDIARRFGQTVAELVEGVTKLTRVQFSTHEEQQVENLRKMFMAMSKDIRVVLIKICDRLHNQRTMEYQTKEKQISKSMETMDVYAPLAHRLGMQKIKWELEDGALRYLDPKGYREIISYLDAHKEESERFMDMIRDRISERMETVGIACTIYGRVKHVYSIYRKMKTQNKSIDELYDLYAFRVIVDSIPDCYNVLGHIHEMFNLVPGRFKDYISMPKPNRYQSLHTTVIGAEGIPFEVQIRTQEMHETAEYGVAAHWKYKQGVETGNEKEFEWIRRLLEDQQDTEAEDYIHSLKVDMFDDEVFVFTPRGKVISLPTGSTPIDFAYAIHSGVGNSMIGAKVNNRIASFDVKLRNGDIVEILTSKTAKGPSRDWLNICQSNQARTKIKQWFKKERREENVQRGRDMLEDELRHNGLTLDDVMDEAILSPILKRLSFTCADDLFAAIGYGGLTATRAANRLRDELKSQEPKRKTALDKVSEAAERRENHAQKKEGKAVHGILVEGLSNCLVKFSRCCTPVPGDDIMGFITRGQGVSIHRRDCANCQQLLSQPENEGRWVHVSWASKITDSYLTTIVVSAKDRSGLVMDVATVLNTLNAKVHSLSARTTGINIGIVTVTLEVKDADELRRIVARLSHVNGVNSVTRNGM